MRPVRRGVYIIPSLLTLANLALGTLSVIYSAAGHYTFSAWAIIGAIALDILDGRIARWAGVTSEFGLELDSLCDLVSFGVAPAVLIYQLALAPMGRPGLAIAVFFVMAAALRLARYNLRAQRGEVTTFFEGLPVPAAAGIMASFVMSYQLFDSPVPLTVKTIPILMRRMPLFFKAVPVAMVLLSFLMISTVHYGNFKKLKLTRAKTVQAVALVAVGLLLIVTYPQNTIFILFLLYVLSGLVAFAVRFYTYRRWKGRFPLRRRRTDLPGGDPAGPEEAGSLL